MLTAEDTPSKSRTEVFEIYCTADSPKFEYKGKNALKHSLRSYNTLGSLNSNLAKERKLFQFLSPPWSSEKHFLCCCISALEPETLFLILSGPIKPVLLSAQRHSLSRWTGPWSHGRLLQPEKLCLLFLLLTTDCWSIKTWTNAVRRKM